MFEQFAQLRPIESKDQLEEVQRIAREDDHDVVNPTDLVVKNGKIVGYLSIASSPIVIGHFSTATMKARDSFTLINIAEHVVQRMGSRNVIWPIGKDSPFHPYFTEMGYKKLANVDLFVKEF